MSFSNTNSRWTYQPNGVTTTFAFDNLVLSADDLAVTWFDSNGDALALPGFGLTGLGNPAGGNVVFNSAPATVAGSLLVIERKSVPQQTGAFGDFMQENAATRQARFDRLLAIGQEWRKALARAFLYSPLDPDGAVVLPPPAKRANMALLFDALGKPTVGAPLAAGALTVGAWIINNLLPVNSRAAALAALGAFGTGDNNTVTGTNAFSGTNTFPTQSPGDASTKAANTAYVDAAVAAGSSLLRSYLAGLGLSTAGASASFTVAPGVAADSGNAKMLALAGALTKTTASWTVGNNQGGLDTGAIANDTWYYVHLIRRTDTGVVDVLISLKSGGADGNPTMPTNYTQRRRIGALRTNGSAQWRSFVQNGDDFTWAAATQEISESNPGTSAKLSVVNVPPAVKVVVELVWHCVFGSSGYPTGLYVSDPATTDQAPTNLGPPFAQVRALSLGSGITHATTTRTRTDTSGQVRWRVSASGGSDAISAATIGWTDRRGRDD